MYMQKYSHRIKTTITESLPYIRDILLKYVVYRKKKKENKSQPDAEKTAPGIWLRRGKDTLGTALYKSIKNKNKTANEIRTRL